MFIFAQLLHGVGAAALTTLGTTLMAESVHKDSAPMYVGLFESSFILGPALGYVVGGRLLNVFTEFYLVEGESEGDTSMGMSVESPKWIGAWWLGFLLIVVLSYVCAFLMVSLAYRTMYYKVVSV